MKKLIQLIVSTICMLIIIISIPACSSKMHSSTNGQSSSNMGMSTQSSSSTTSMQQHASAVLSGSFPDTTVTGTAQFDAQADGKVKMHLQISIPAKANKSVAVHLHAMGDCGDMGKAAGGHWNPTNAQHGKWGSASFHSGDIGNVALDAQGNGSMELETNLWTLGGDASTNILNKTVMVHGGTDDYTSQPSGNAGTRIGCGIIK